MSSDTIKLSLIQNEVVSNTIQPDTGLNEKHSVDGWIRIQGKPVSPITAALLNLIPGVGHMVNGQYQKGVGVCVFTVILAVSIIIPIIGLICFIYYVVINMMDAYKIAERIRAGYPVMKGECSYAVVTLGLSYFEKTPVFVSGSYDAPPEWITAIRNFERSNFKA